MINKLAKAYHSGVIKEKLFNTFVRRYNVVFLNLYRLISPLLHSQCTKIIDKYCTDKVALINTLKNVFGDLNSFKEMINEKEKNAIIGLAENYIAHRFSLFGYDNLNLNPIDWHTDFISGYRWEPGKFYRDYVQVNLNNSADVKIPRELSRSHHLIILAEAYLLTGDEKYVEEYVQQSINWIDENPFMHSINWACTMDVAIRAVNWIWSMAMLINSTLLTVDVLKKILSSLFEHGYFIYRNPEKALHNNHNHYIANLVGQIYLGLFFKRLFKNLSEPNRWLYIGILELYREMRYQILPSGVHYERSINYHRLVLELMSSAIILLDKNNFEIPLDIWYRLEKMFEFVMYYLKPDGTAPVIGDQDDGRLHPFSPQNNLDHRYLLSIGSILFSRDDFKSCSKSYTADCFFLFGPESKRIFDKIPSKKHLTKSKGFSDAGFFIFRKKRDYMFINNSGKSRYNEIAMGTHTHSDLLSFELFIDNKSFLIDPGSYVYSANPKLRKYYRSTMMHNTVVVDRENQNIIRKQILWDFERNALPKLNRYKLTEKYDIFDGEHTGYQRLENPVIHRRKIYFFKKRSEWRINDFLEGKGNHLFEWYFHFDSGIDFEINNNSIKTICYDGINIAMVFYSKKFFYLEKEDGWVSKAYGAKERSKILKISLKRKCPLSLQTVIRRI